MIQRPWGNSPSRGMRKLGEGMTRAYDTGTEAEERSGDRNEDAVFSK